MSQKKHKQINQLLIWLGEIWSELLGLMAKFLLYGLSLAALLYFIKYVIYKALGLEL